MKDKTLLGRRELLKTGGIVAAGSLLAPAMFDTVSAQSIEVADELNIVPSKTSSQHDFDFYNGKWKVHNKKLKKRLQGSNEWLEFEATDEGSKILNGFGSMNFFRTQLNGVPFEGMTLRLFNPKTRLWSIYWVASNIVVLDIPNIGSFEGKIGKFYTKDVWEGKKVIVRFIYDGTNPDVVVWSQAFSTDNQKTWETNWIMTSYRQS